MKTRISQLVAVTFFALFILVGNVNAKGTEKSASSHEIEATLELESWMLNENYWKSGISFDLANVSDEKLEVETWMINENTWKPAKKISLETETEETLSLETWMTDENIWNR
jgi:hypothetical protein